jgi:nicotinamidase-related amidase
METHVVDVLSLNPKLTAVVLIDLQNGLMNMKPMPHSVSDVMAHSAELATALRNRGGTVVYVRVDINNMLPHKVDSPSRNSDAPPLPAAASELSPNIGFQKGDVIVTKHSWGAFYGTDLDQQMRHRDISTIILAGVATNMGVESTARAAFDHGYNLILAEDAMSSVSTEAHDFAIKMIFPRIGRVRSTKEILTPLTQ